MSQSLYWRPRETGDRLPDELRLKLNDRLFRSQKEAHVRKSSNWHEFIKGLAAAGVDEATHLAEKIEEHGVVVLELKQ